MEIVHCNTLAPIIIDIYDISKCGYGYCLGELK